MLIHFVHGGDAYLPELAAYLDFLRGRGHEGIVHRSATTIPATAAVVWWMCGLVPPRMQQRLAHATHVHEYASASVPPWAWTKDRAKRWLQPRAHYRIFQNEWVRTRMGFTDGVPWELRDMGVSAPFLSDGPTAHAIHDFVYLGEMRRLSRFLPLLEGLAQAGRSLLLIGEIPVPLRASLLRHGQVTATGRVPHADVPAWLRRARYGLNLVPAQAPYGQQTSTKLLEYCAVGLPVVSTDYPWMRQFTKQQGGYFAYVPPRGDAADYAAALGPLLDQQPLSSPDVRHLAWPVVLERMAIWRQLGITAP